jgi:hypothetical protein
MVPPVIESLQETGLLGMDPGKFIEKQDGRLIVR